MRISRWGFPIIDFHTHFPVPDEHPAPADVAYRRRFGDRKADILHANWRRYQEEWWTAYGFPFPEEHEPPPEIQAQRWSEEIEGAGLEAVVFVTGGGNRTLAPRRGRSAPDARLRPPRPLPSRRGGRAAPSSGRGRYARLQGAGPRP